MAVKCPCTNRPRCLVELCKMSLDNRCLRSVCFQASGKGLQSGVWMAFVVAHVLAMICLCSSDVSCPFKTREPASGSFLFSLALKAA